jgi:hypothetical protein
MNDPGVANINSYQSAGELMWLLLRVMTRDQCGVRKYGTRLGASFGVVVI